MFDYTNIITAYQTLIGYQQRKDPKYNIIEGANLVNESDSINTESPELLKTERLIDCFDNFDKFIYNTWDIATAYALNDVIAYSGKEYKAIQAGTGNQPDITPLFWEEIQDIPSISTTLQEYKDRGIREAFRDVFRERANNDIKNLLNSSFLYEFGGVRDESGNWKTITKQGFHGIQLTSYTIPYQTLKLNKVGFHFTGAESFNLYVYHSSGDAPLHTIAVNYTTPNEWQWIDLTDITLKYYTNSKSPAGVFYVGYFASDISSDIIASDWANNYNIPYYGWCGNCHHGQKSYDYMTKYTKYLTVEPSTFTTNELNGTDKPFGVGGIGGWMPGINLNVTVYRDPEQSIITNADHFLPLVRMKTALLLLEGMKNNVRINRGSELSKDHIIRELEGYANENIKGLYDGYKEKLMEVQSNLNNLDGFCDMRQLPTDVM